MKIFFAHLIPIIILTTTLALITPYFANAIKTGSEDLDARVKKFLDSHDWGWGDMNVPSVDGQTLHDIIVKNKYTKALEIGT